MQDRTITAALMALRVQIVREDRNRLEQVEALLRQRGVRLKPVPRARRTPFRRNELRREVVAMLRIGPKSRADIAAQLEAAHGFTHRRAYMCAGNTLNAMRRRAWAAVEDGLSGLVTPAALEPTASLRLSGSI